MTSNPAPGLSIATALFFTWSILTFAVRAWVKVRQRDSWGWDDTTISAALVVALLHVISIFWSIHTGNGSEDNNLLYQNQDILDKTIYASQLLYVSSLGLVRISAGFFVARLIRRGQEIKLAYALTATCGIWMVASVLTIGLRGDPKKPWSSLDGLQLLFVRWMGVEISGSVLDVASCGLCMRTIWTLSMPLKKRVAVMAILGFRLLLIPIVALRLVCLSPRRNTDPDVANTLTDILTEAAMNFALMSACVTCLKPFLKPFDTEYVVTTVEPGSVTWPSSSGNKSRDPYHKLIATNNSSKNRSVTAVSARDTASYELREKFRPDRFDQHTTISAQPVLSERGENAIGEMMIRKTESWSVRIEDDQ